MYLGGEREKREEGKIHTQTDRHMQALSRAVIRNIFLAVQFRSRVSSMSQTWN